MITGITQFCYTREMPTDAVGIAQLSSSVATPAQLVDINNATYLPASLGVWKLATADSSPADFIAPDYNQTLTISASLIYKIDNQFFDLTNVSNNGVVYWYVHVLPSYATSNATILDLSGNPITVPYYVVGRSVYHNFYDNGMLIQYSDTNGYLHTDLLNVTQVITKDAFTTSNTTYLLTGRQLNVASTEPYFIRFTQPAGFLAVSPWNDQSNTPWYARIRFPLNPFPVEWANQIFSPKQPFMAASFVPGQVLSTRVMEFERKDLYTAGNLPDILVYNSDYSIKYALDGSPQGSPRKKGNEFPWKRGLINSIDAHTARAMVAVDLDPTDIVYAFYQYQEPDILYRQLDINPFTNPVVKNSYVEFYVKTTGVSGLNSIYYKIVDPVTGDVTSTNDTDPTGGAPVTFSTISVGAAVSTSSITIEDIRVRGGGLLEAYQTEAESISCWDLGFWDGKPYPVSGGLLVYLPITLLEKFDRSSILALVQEVLPAGAFPVIKFYSSDGTESV